MLDKEKQKQLRSRKVQLEEWLDACSPLAAADQKHLDEGTPEHAYWHVGYKAALADVLSLIDKPISENGNKKLN